MTTPDDRDCREAVAYTLRYQNGTLKLWPSHDSYADRIGAAARQHSQRARDEVPIEVAVDDARRVPAVERGGQVQNRKRKARVAGLGDRGIDEQDVPGSRHDTDCGLEGRAS